MSISVLKMNSKSFYWSGLLLPHEILKDISTLYAFCRKMDDLIDEYNNPAQVQKILDAIKNNETIEISDIINKYSIDKSLIIIFLETLLKDVSPVKYHTIEDLLRYCYGVASSIGIMLSFILGNRNRSTLYHAIDLGIAMQLTNIARDMAEDHIKEKYYFPAAYDQKALIKLAESYYNSGIYGVYNLPSYARPAIMTAAYLYRAIGYKILKNPQKAKTSRIIVNSFEKAFLTLQGVLACMSKPEIIRHNNSMHKMLTGLPYVNNGKLNEQKII
jgi:phytoene synthase